MAKLRIGILFGGPSREREISYLGGKTAYENMDKALFEPIPIFVDSLGNFILIKPELLYENMIRDFYPSRNQNRGFSIYIESLGKLSDVQLYKLIHKIGRQLTPQELAESIDFAFVIMHGPSSEDGSIQGLLEWYGIPYMGPGVVGSGIGIDKIYQNKLLNITTGQKKKFSSISRTAWQHADHAQVFNTLIDQLGLPIVVKAPHQGSSIGVAIVRKRSLEEFEKAVQQCFFEITIEAFDWSKQSPRQQRNFAQKMANLDEGIGFPLYLNEDVVYHPADLPDAIDEVFKNGAKSLKLTSKNAEDTLLFEEFIEGQEFSCGVFQDDDGTPIALPPTEVYGEIQTFDFKSKYQSSLTRKRTPVLTSDENLYKIHEKVLKAFDGLGFEVVTRIDGFLKADDTVLLHDPNTIPGMSPASFIFKQTAEIGLNITQAITYLIRQSLRERIRAGKNTVAYRQLLEHLDDSMEQQKREPVKRVAILFSEKANEYAIAKKKYAEFAASELFSPIPVLVNKDGDLLRLPVNLMFKDRLEDLQMAIATPKHPFLNHCIEQAKPLIKRYTSGFEQDIKAWSDVDLASHADAMFHVANQQLVEF